jgi:hypothetical protein
MNRNEKIRLIKGLLLGTIELEELAEQEIEVWIQVIGTDLYKHFKTEEILSNLEIAVRENLNRKVIRINFVKGKTIL